ncbi:MAG TPA: hypothetical protein VIK25_00740 [Gemmatimonadaceae bacterium]
MRRTSLPLVALLLSLCLTTGCAGGPAVASGTRTDPTLITRAQIQDSRFATAYDAVRALHSNWLTARGTESFSYPTEVQVYLDGVRMGGLDMLQNIASPPVQYIRFFSGIEASSRWGLDHGRGVIWVSTDANRPGASGPPPDTQD